MVDTFAFQIEWTIVGMAIDLLTALIAVFFTGDGTGIKLTGYARPPLPAAVVH